MSVRLCYLERARRGGLLRALRLVGQGVDERWPGAAPRLDSLEAALPWIDRGAEWVQEQLSQTRSAGFLEALVLDVDGATCSWVAGLGSDYQAIAAAARLGHVGGVDSLPDMPGGESSAATPVTFFAGEASDSTIQPLANPAGEDEEDEGASGGVGLLARLKKPKGKKESAPVGRRGILAACDVPGRLFIDSLDRRGVEVGRPVTLWHAIAQVWDPASELRSAASHGGEVISASGPVCAVVLVDGGDTDASIDDADATPPRLIWAWSRGGSLLAGGSMRLAHSRGEERPELSLDQGEASRLATEWLAWSMQLGVTPNRVVCVLPKGTSEDGSAARFGSALTKAWPGATGDAGFFEDPIGATLGRLATALEATPATRGLVALPGEALVELSARPGGAHRSMYTWLAGVVLVASVVMGVVAWQAGRSAERLNQAAKVWADKGVEAATSALGRSTVDPLDALRTEVRVRERELVPPPRAVPAEPVLEEIETITMVIANEDITLESLDLSSGDLVRMTLTAPKVATLEKVTEALRRISGSHVNAWDANYREYTDSKGAQAVRATYSATWQDTRSPAGGGQ